MDNDLPDKPVASPTHPPPLIIKADELDPTGTDVSTPTDEISTPITPALQASPSHSPQSLSDQPFSSSPRAAAVRPILRREGSTPAPPLQPPPPTPREQNMSQIGGQEGTDSLSLQQLRQLVTNLPKLEPQAYAYEHADTRSFPEEVEEWFPYSEEEKYMLLRGKEAFETQWERMEGSGNWVDVEDAARTRFVQSISERMENGEEDIEGLECLAYVAMGCWGETAGLEDDKASNALQENAKQNPWRGVSHDQFVHSAAQIRWIRNGCSILTNAGAVQAVFNVLRKACDGEQSVGPLPLNRPIPTKARSLC